MKSTLVISVAMATLTGCATVTLPDGTKVSKEVYRAEAAQDLMTLAVTADREYDSRNPITPPPAVCTEETGGLSGSDLAYCAMAMATYNAQLQVREQSRKAKVAYANAVIDRQIAERERRMDRIFSLAGIVYQTERGSRVSSRGASSGPVVQISGHQVRGNHKGGGAGSDGDFAGLGGSTGASITGDQNVTVVIGDHNQSGAGDGMYAPVLEYATDMGSTRPVVGEGGSYAPIVETDDRDTVGLGDVL